MGRGAALAGPGPARLRAAGGGRDLLRPPGRAQRTRLRRTRAPLMNTRRETCPPLTNTRR
ncbi:hypothetical protein CQW44_30000 [Streptomyces griseofuscus]|uniref:Uncharacterized protein n=1 Tax=Streptomyces griseofuscus TaxID=146922 RepID=A0A3R8RXB2_9ACTN|nr:hypothetical protein CQW44_30000 [Streptomyces griseofuscus]